jgi:hypothetical protein
VVPTDFTIICLTAQDQDIGREAVAFLGFINSPGCQSPFCGFVGVEERAWSAVKGLYR